MIHPGFDDDMASADRSGTKYGGCARWERTSHPSKKTGLLIVLLGHQTEMTLSLQNAILNTGMLRIICPSRARVSPTVSPFSLSPASRDKRNAQGSFILFCRNSVRLLVDFHFSQRRPTGTWQSPLRFLGVFFPNLKNEVDKPQDPASRKYRATAVTKRAVMCSFSGKRYRIQYSERLKDKPGVLRPHTDDYRPGEYNPVTHNRPSRFRASVRGTLHDGFP